MMLPVENAPVHGMIASRIANNIRVVKMGPNIHELRYNVLMKRENIFGKMYPPEQAMGRLHSTTRQTASMIKGEIKTGEMCAVEENDKTLKIEKKTKSSK